MALRDLRGQWQPVLRRHGIALTKGMACLQLACTGTFLSSKLTSEQTPCTPGHVRHPGQRDAVRGVPAAVPALRLPLEDGCSGDPQGRFSFVVSAWVRGSSCCVSRPRLLLLRYPRQRAESASPELTITPQAFLEANGTTQPDGTRADPPLGKFEEQIQKYK